MLKFVITDLTSDQEMVVVDVVTAGLIAELLANHSLSINDVGIFIVELEEQAA